jgi:hypothetical protein
VESYRTSYEPVSAANTRRAGHRELHNSHGSIRQLSRAVKIAGWLLGHPRFLLSAETVAREQRDLAQLVAGTSADGRELRRRALLTAVVAAYWLQLPPVHVVGENQPAYDLREDFAERLQQSAVVTAMRASPMADVSDGFVAVSPSQGVLNFAHRAVDAVFSHLKPHVLAAEHAVTGPLKEHLFAMLLCSQLRIPLLITGPPGCSKTLSYQLFAQGFASESAVARIGAGLKYLEDTAYQCSELSTAREIDAVFRNAREQGAHGLGCSHPMVFLDEASLAPRALKAIHEPFDHAEVAAVVLSNLQLDAAKTRSGARTLATRPRICCSWRAPRRGSTCTEAARRPPTSRSCSRACARATVCSPLTHASKRPSTCATSSTRCAQCAARV